LHGVFLCFVGSLAVSAIGAVAGALVAGHRGAEARRAAEIQQILSQEAGPECGGGCSVHPLRRGRGEEWLRALRRKTEGDAAQDIAAAVAGVRGAFVLMIAPPFGAAITVSASERRRRRYAWRRRTHHRRQLLGCAAPPLRMMARFALQTVVRSERARRATRSSRAKVDRSAQV
jgi:hypothetical protein